MKPDTKKQVINQLTSLQGSLKLSDNRIVEVVDRAIKVERLIKVDVRTTPDEKRNLPFNGRRL